jgi:hypothetical protein
MTILKNKKMKIKLSAVLMIALAVLLIGSMFASNYILKKEYLAVSKQKHFPYKELTNQPFKHLKLVQGEGKIYDSFYNPPSNYGQLRFEKSDTFSVQYHSINHYDRRGEDTITAKIVGDTLIITASRPTQSFSDRDVNLNLRIYAPKLESITCVNSSLYGLNLDPNNIRLALFGYSIFSFPKNLKSVVSLDATLNHNSELRLDSLLNINTLNLNMMDKSVLRMPHTQVENFKIKAEEGTLIEAQSKLFNTKMKH